MLFVLTAIVELVDLVWSIAACSIEVEFIIWGLLSLSSMTSKGFLTLYGYGTSKLILLYFIYENGTNSSFVLFTARSLGLTPTLLDFKCEHDGLVWGIGGRGDSWRSEEEGRRIGLVELLEVLKTPWSGSIELRTMLPIKLSSIELLDL